MKGDKVYTAIGLAKNVTRSDRSLTGIIYGSRCYFFVCEQITDTPARHAQKRCAGEPAKESENKEDRYRRG